MLRRVGAYLAAVDGSGRHRKATIGRAVVGVVLVLAGVGGIFGVGHRHAATTAALLGAGAVIAGFVIVFGPWWLRLGRDLAAERRERVRSEERAEMAAHLHDCRRRADRRTGARRGAPRRPPPRRRRTGRH